MANLNIEPGMSPIEALVRGIEHGIMMDTNRSWSIDDQRNKFQFGCECGWVIKDGEVKGLVKKSQLSRRSRDLLAQPSTRWAMLAPGG